MRISDWSSDVCSSDLSKPHDQLGCIRLCPIWHSRERDSSRNDVYTDAAQCLQRRPDQGYGCRPASDYALAGAGGPGECHSLPCIGGSQYDYWASYAGGWWPRSIWIARSTNTALMQIMFMSRPRRTRLAWLAESSGY